MWMMRAEEPGRRFAEPAAEVDQRRFFVHWRLRRGRGWARARTAASAGPVAVSSGRTSNSTMMKSRTLFPRTDLAQAANPTSGTFAMGGPLSPLYRCLAEAASNGACRGQIEFIRWMPAFAFHAGNHADDVRADPLTSYIGTF